MLQRFARFYDTVGETGGKRYFMLKLSGFGTFVALFFKSLKF